MLLSHPVLIWGLLGLLLMFAELLIPGGIVIFLGLAALLVALALWLGLISTLVHSLILFFISSIVLLLVFRSFTQRLIGGDSHVANTDETLDIYGQSALVKQTIGPGQHAGRVLFQGSEWPALGDGETIAEGQTVTVINRDNIHLIVSQQKISS